MRNTKLRGRGGAPLKATPGKLPHCPNGNMSLSSVCEIYFCTLDSQYSHNICVASPGHQRALCAVACLLTCDLLSLEQIFGATRHRLGKLSEGPQGSLTNKATKVAESCPHVNKKKQDQLVKAPSDCSKPSLCDFCARYCASSKPCWAGPGVSSDRKW